MVRRDACLAYALDNLTSSRRRSNGCFGGVAVEVLEDVWSEFSVILSMCNLSRCM